LRLHHQIAKSRLTPQPAGPVGQHGRQTGGAFSKIQVKLQEVTAFGIHHGKGNGG
jgi:hypothetical protein